MTVLNHKSTSIYLFIYSHFIDLKGLFCVTFDMKWFRLLCDMQTCERPRSFTSSTYSVVGVLSGCFSFRLYFSAVSASFRLTRWDWLLS